MSADPLQVSPRGERRPVHPTITSEQISLLVEEFYGKIRAHERLGMLFADNMERDWPEHLERMKTFWRSVLLKSGEYKGRPIPVHMKLPEIRTEDFREWLRLFDETAREVLAPGARPIVLEAAERIATSLWLARSTDIFSNPPKWSEGRRQVNGDLLEC